MNYPIANHFSRAVLKHFSFFFSFVCIFAQLLAANPWDAYTHYPEFPAIERKVHGIEEVSPTDSDLRLVGPLIPAKRTSNDGRISMSAQNDSGPKIYLNKPELMTQSVVDYEFGAEFILGDETENPTITINRDEVHPERDNQNNSAAVIPRHRALFDMGPFDASIAMNPYSGVYNNIPCDVYDLYILSGVGYNMNEAIVIGDQDKRHLRFHLAKIRVYVSNPKTADAKIESAEVIPEGLENYVSTGRIYAKDCFEPFVTNDGQLLVFRIAGQSNLLWKDNDQNTRAPVPDLDIVYAYRDTTGLSSLSQWEDLRPITHAPYDTRINGKYGFAMNEFRDFENNVIPDGSNLRGGYPWLDKKGNNICFTTFNEPLFLGEKAGGDYTDADDARFQNRGVRLVSNHRKKQNNGRAHLGRSIMGLWTQGKAVMMGNMINHTDISLQSRPNWQRELKLYRDGPNEGYVRVGAGREDSGAVRDVWGVTSNFNFFDSIENDLNYNEHMKPTMPFDVVWYTSSGVYTDQFAFDDYLHLDSFIVSHMNGLASMTYSPDSDASDQIKSKYRADPKYYDGWDRANDTFSYDDVKFENAGAAMPDRWKIPTHAETVGDVRVEPVALGGIEGKGVWLEEDAGLHYKIPADQPSSFSDHEWYIGLFVDCRFDNDSTIRSLITFPDGTEINTVGRDQILYQDSNSTDVHTIDLPFELPRSGWGHLAFQVFNGGNIVEFYYNGFLVEQFIVPSGDSLFQMVEAGDLYLGVKDPNATGDSFTGWIDNFKVFGQAMDFENAANHAGGTLVGFNESEYPGGSPDLLTRANLYEEAIHDCISEQLAALGESTYDRYAVHYDYTQDHGAGLHNIPTGTVGLRESFLFPEGPLFHNGERPHSRQNLFCLQCHAESSHGGLGLDALDVMHDLMARNDGRRQPLQPPARISGRIPGDWLDRSPNNEQDYGLGSYPIDRWLMRGIHVFQNEVLHFNLINAETQIVVDQLEDSIVTSNSLWDIEVVVDAAQGSVVIEYDSDSVTRNKPFYSLFGFDDEELAFSPGTFEPGMHTITATPYSGENGTGTPGVSKTVTFKVIENKTVVDFKHREGTHLILGNGRKQNSLNGDTWYFSDVDALFNGPETGGDSNTGLIYGGLQASWEIDDDTYDPAFQLRNNSDLLHLQVNPPDSSDYRKSLKGMLVWKKEHFLSHSEDAIIFGPGSSMSLTRANSGASTTLRFVVNDGGTYYVSNASHSGSMTLLEPGSDDWAPINTSNYSIGTYGPRSFLDIRAVGIYLEQSAYNQTILKLAGFEVSATPVD